ncbi:hypothetical protein LCGC14_0535630 [marine sediment metagenome]|uniref:Uncharacterized protein n=1 Tax=marine sediment metagenome TaxID=412755 RepID=A0A0F9RYY4_9ZZZZ
MEPESVIKCGAAIGQIFAAGFFSGVGLIMLILSITAWSIYRANRPGKSKCIEEGEGSCEH